MASWGNLEQFIERGYKFINSHSIDVSWCTTCVTRRSSGHSSRGVNSVSTFHFSWMWHKNFGPENQCSADNRSCSFTSHNARAAGLTFPETCDQIASDTAVCIDETLFAPYVLHLFEWAWIQDNVIVESDQRNLGIPWSSRVSAWCFTMLASMGAALVLAIRMLK